MSDTLLRLPVVMEQTGCKRSKLYALVAAGAFPKPIKIDSCACWSAQEVSEWIEQRKSDRPTVIGAKTA